MILAWVYATISIAIISLCGLVGIAIVPLAKSIAYDEILRFLIALAIGTLCGDALMVGSLKNFILFYHKTVVYFSIYCHIRLHLTIMEVWLHCLPMEMLTMTQFGSVVVLS